MSGTRPPRVLFLSQFFEPETVYKGLSFVKALEARGYRTDVLTAFPMFGGGRHAARGIGPVRREVMDRIRVTRVPLYSSHDDSGVRRSLTYLSFFLSATFYLLVRMRRYDVIYVYHPPITVGLAAAVSGLIRRTPFVIEVQDMWPEAVAASGMANSRVERTLGAICRFVYRRARRIVAQSRGIGAEVAQRGGGDRVRPIYNWAEEGDLISSGTTDLSPYGLDGRFTFVFGGNMGIHQALDTAVDAALKAAAQVPEIRLVLVGGGVQADALRRRAAEDGRDIVRVLPGIARAKVADLFKAAQVLLVHLADKPLYAVTVPSKTQFYLAIGKPVLAGLAGEAAGLLREARCGLVVPPEDVDALAAAMVTLARTPEPELAAMGENGRRFYLENMSFDGGMEQIVGVIDEAIGR